MGNTIHKTTYIEQLNKLETIIDTINLRLIADNPDQLIYNNANFFTKSFLVIMCTYLESYLKDVLMVIIDEMNSRLIGSKLPHNLIKWSYDIKKEFKENEYQFENLQIKIKKKDLDEFISGNPYRTVHLFKKFGIDLSKDSTFSSQQEQINLIIIKRNKIVHHNDEASDVSTYDLKMYIFAIKNYIVNLDTLACKHIE